MLKAATVPEPRNVQRELSRAILAGDPVDELQAVLLYTAGDVARFLRVSDRTLARWRQNGELRGYTFSNKAVRYSLEDVKAFVDSRRDAE